jgi:hypothetical protein
MRRISFTMLASILLVSGSASFAGDAKHNVVPKDGYVPNAETPIRIAVAVWTPIYGADNIARQKPYHATLRADGAWVVEGSLPKGWLGGVALAEVSKLDGHILRVSHGR